MRDTFIPTVAKRGAAIIEARGASSAASAANAAIDHVHTWVHGTPDGRLDVGRHRLGRLVRRARGAHLVVPGDRPSGGEWQIVPDLESTSSPAARIDASVAELVEERDAVRALGLL